MADQKFTIEEIIKRIQDLKSKAQETLGASFESIRKNNKNSKESPYSQMSFEELISLESKMEHLFDGPIESEFIKLQRDSMSIDKSSLSAEQWKMSEETSKQLAEIENVFRYAKEELETIKGFESGAIEKFVNDPYFSQTKLPKEMPLTTRYQILSAAKKVAWNKQDKDMSNLVKLILFTYVNTPANDKQKIAQKLQDIVKDSMNKQLVKSIRENMPTILTAKAFSDEDKAVLKGIFEKKFFIAEIFRKATAKLNKSNNNNIVISQGRDSR